MSVATAPILLTGSTGYIGGRLLHEFEKRNIAVRCLSRRPEVMRARADASTEVIQGDVLDADSLAGTMDGVKVAYYMIHSMGADEGFAEKDRIGALNFAEEAKRAGVEKIIYLGGLGDEEEDLSLHLRSRMEVGTCLRATGIPVLEFRASIVIGSGSLSFEMVRALVERLPVMITPRWVDVMAQPIAITDLLEYLVAGTDLPVSDHQIVEIGGTSQVSYGDIMEEYARQRNLKRYTFRVPFLTPHLSSLWLGLVTPLYARIGKKLINSIEHPTVVTDDTARQLFPNISPRSVEEAVHGALNNEEERYARTRWSDALSAAGYEADWGGVRFGNRLVDSREIEIATSPEAAFTPIQRIGGEKGWYYGNWLWQIRGFMDLLMGGVGVRRGRRHPDELAVGDALDFWRVEVYEPNRRLRLFAEMKLPGRAWLEFCVTPTETGTTIRQTAVYDPVGLWGLMYWYAVYPLHEFVFGGMLEGIAAEALEKAPLAATPSATVLNEVQLAD